MLAPSLSVFPVCCCVIHPCAQAHTNTSAGNRCAFTTPRTHQFGAFYRNQTALVLGWETRGPFPHSSTPLVQFKVSHYINSKPPILWRWDRAGSCQPAFMIYHRVQLVTGNWNSGDLLLNCGRDSFRLKTEADYLDERAADLEMYAICYLRTVSLDSCYLS